MVPLTNILVFKFFISTNIARNTEFISPEIIKVSDVIGISEFRLSNSRTILD